MLELNTCCLIGMMFWGKEEASKCLPEKNLILSPALPHLVLLLGSDQSQHCLCISNWPGLEMHGIFSLWCTHKSTSPSQTPFCLFRSLFKFPTYCLVFLLSFFSAWAIFSEFPILLTFILQGTFLLLLPRDHILPKTLIFLTYFLHPSSVGGQFPL